MTSVKTNLGITLACFACVAGCGKGKKSPQFDLTPVTGTITLDGQPLADADVGFVYQGQPPAGFYGSAGRTDASGRYELKTGDKNGAIPGMYSVTVSRIATPDGVTLKPEEGMDMGQLQRSGEIKETVPTKYTDATTSELSTNVEKGKADGYDFALKSG